MLEAYSKSFVARTLWVFGIANNNFNSATRFVMKSYDMLKVA